MMKDQMIFLRLETSQGQSLFTQLYTGSFSEDNNARKHIRLGKEETKLFSDLIICLENPKESTRKLLELMSNLSKIAGYKVDRQKSIVFLYTHRGKKIKTEIKQYYLSPEIASFQYLFKMKYLVHI